MSGNHNITVGLGSLCQELIAIDPPVSGGVGIGILWMVSGVVSSRDRRSSKPVFFPPGCCMNSEVDPTQSVSAETEQAFTSSGSVLSEDAPWTDSKQHGLISKVLSPAVGLWLRSQLEHVEDLHLSIEAGDRQILTGAIDRVTASARSAVYQGLHLSQAALTGVGIRTNLRQVLRGKPLRLLEAFPVTGEVCLTEADLNASLQAPLLANAVIDFLLTLLNADPESELSDRAGESIQLQEPQAVLGDGHITFTASLMAASGTATAVVIRTGLRIEQGNQLKLDRPQWLPHANARQGFPLKDLDGLTFDLGSDVKLEQLTLAMGQILCCGQLMVRPEE